MYIYLYITVCVHIYRLIIPKINSFSQRIKKRFWEIYIFFASWQCLIHLISTDEFFVCHISSSKHSREVNKSSCSMFWETSRKPPMQAKFALRASKLQLKTTYNWSLSLVQGVIWKFIKIILMNRRTTFQKNVSLLSNQSEFFSF